MKNIHISSRLFARPSFEEGISRVLDLGGTMQEYNTSKTENSADTEALKSDWRIVGDDLKLSIKSYEQELSKSA